MKIIIIILLIAILLFVIYKNITKIKNRTEKRISVLIKEQLNINIPKDLLDIWSCKDFEQKDRVFFYYSFRDLRFLSPNEIHVLTKQRIVQGAMDEYNKIDKNNPDKNRYYNDFFQDPIMLSKFVNPKVENFEEISKSLVFASSVFNEHFVQMFYAFDKQDNNLGIWITKGDKSIYPSKIGNNLKEVFKDTDKLKERGFEKISNFYTYFNEVCNENKPETPFGIYPKDIKKIINSEIDKILWFDDADLSTLEQNIKIEIEKFFLLNGLKVNLLDDNTEFLLDKINDISKKNFNYDFKKNFMIITLENYCEGGDILPFSNAIVYVDKNEGRVLDKLGVLNFDNLYDTNKYKFLKYEKE